MSKFDPEIQKVVARLKIETKLKHLRDKALSKGSKWQQKFAPKSMDYSFFKILDGRTANINRAHPISFE